MQKIMKKKLILVAAIAFFVAQTWSRGQENSSNADRNYRIPLIGETAPSFTASTTNGQLTFPDDFGRKWKILFSHPQDFTPVCSTEILELARLQDKFDKLDAKIAVISTDPLYMHNEWKKALEKIDFDGKGTVQIKFPIIDDENVRVSQLYGMIHKESNSTRAVRGVFVIDPDNIVQAIYFYPNSVGRDTDELMRMLSALETTRKDKVSTPVNWQTGQDVMVPYNPGKDNPVTLNNPPAGYYAPAWFMWYKKAD